MFILIIAASSEKVEYGCPCKVIFARLYLNLSIFKQDKKASKRATTMATRFDTKNNLTLGTDGDIAELTPSMPHTQNMVPHQIPCPYS